MSTRKASKTRNQNRIAMADIETQAVAKVPEASESSQSSALEGLRLFLKNRPEPIVIRQAKTMDEITVGILFPNRKSETIVTQ